MYLIKLHSFRPPLTNVIQTHFESQWPGEWNQRPVEESFWEGAQWRPRVVSLDRALSCKRSFASCLSRGARASRLHEAVYRTHQKDPRLGVRRRRFIPFCWSSHSLLLGGHGIQAEHRPRAAHDQLKSFARILLLELFCWKEALPFSARKGWYCV